jgi:predicted DNA-binding transcriptional regulator AlpA
MIAHFWKVGEMTIAINNPSPIRQIDDLPELSTRKMLSEFTDIAVQTFARYAVEGKGPRITRLGGTAVRYRKADVLAWLEASAA